ncbi:TBC1 domain family member 1, partial [Sarcoptes scabiei]
MACDTNFLSAIKFRGSTELETWMMRWYKKKKRKVPVPKSIVHPSNSPRSELLSTPDSRIVFVFVFPSYRSVTSNAVSAFHHLYRFVTSHRILNLFQISIAFFSPDVFFVFVVHLYRFVTFNAVSAFHHPHRIMTLVHQIWNLFQILIAFIFLSDVNIGINPGSDPEIVVTFKQREDDESHLMISLPDENGAVDGRYLRDGRRTQSRVQETIKKFLLIKTATGILMIELHHLGGGLPDPDGSHQQAGSITGLEKKAMSHRNRLYRIAVLYCSRIFENYHHRWLKLEEQQQYQHRFAAQNHQHRTGKMAAMAATYLYQTRINGAKQTRGGAAVSVALYRYRLGNAVANHHRLFDYVEKY